MEKESFETMFCNARSLAILFYNQNNYRESCTVCIVVICMAYMSMLWCVICQGNLTCCHFLLPSHPLAENSIKIICHSFYSCKKCTIFELLKLKVVVKSDLTLEKCYLPKITLHFIKVEIIFFSASRESPVNRNNLQTLTLVRPLGTNWY